MSTLNGTTLNLMGIREINNLIAVQSDGWESGGYKRKIKPYGSVKSWLIRCYENNVDYDGSDCEAFKALMVAGTVVSLVLDVGSIGGGKLHSLSATDVKVLNVGLDYDADYNNPNYREFDLTLQEET